MTKNRKKAIRKAAEIEMELVVTQIEFEAIGEWTNRLQDLMIEKERKTEALEELSAKLAKELEDDFPVDLETMEAQQMEEGEYAHAHHKAGKAAARAFRGFRPADLDGLRRAAEQEAKRTPIGLVLQKHLQKPSRRKA